MQRDEDKGGSNVFSRLSYDPADRRNNAAPPPRSRNREDRCVTGHGLLAVARPICFSLPLPSAVYYLLPTLSHSNSSVFSLSLSLSTCNISSLFYTHSNSSVFSLSTMYLSHTLEFFCLLSSSTIYSFFLYHRLSLSLFLCSLPSAFSVFLSLPVSLLLSRCVLASYFYLNKSHVFTLLWCYRQKDKQAERK